ncbi:hypothetical protein OKW50_000098 [Paraburkholderia youngii]|uniref:AIPR family protein n=1 Tax=Paraburkholderia youngii TaxID=2782701 RepID=UPI003D194601
MDLATKGLVAEFVRENSLTTITDISTQFEHFSAFALVSGKYQDAIDTTEIVVGGDAEYGIDAVAVVVNDSLVYSAADVDEIANQFASLQASIYITQSETSSAFDLQKLSHFGACVADIFQERYEAKKQTGIKKKIDTLDRLYHYAAKFRQGNPQLFLYYATTGTYNEDDVWKARRTSIEKTLVGTNLFSKVSVECIGATVLQKQYVNSKNAVSREIVFDRRTALPEMPDVKEAYVGALLAEEFLKLIEDENGELMRSVFYDNVRDWQDYNDVNTEIKNTLEDEKKRQLFSLLNNGVTLLARQIRPTGDRFSLEDYQIVNGCQTSNVLHRHRDSIIGKNVYIPVRLVSTTNDDVTVSVTRATNRQTSVSQEELLAVSDFQKKLELFFASYNQQPIKRLYYERRSRQYNAEPDIEKVRVVSMTTLIRTFSAMFLGTPHRTTRSYKTLLGSVGKEIFGANHKLEPYYACAFAWYRLEYFFRNQTIHVKYKPARYQILLAIRFFAIGSGDKQLNSKEIVKDAGHLAECAWSVASFEKIVKRSCELIEFLSNGEMDRDFLHTEEFTKKIYASFSS